jgi:hypothetical protein
LLSEETSAGNGEMMDVTFCFLKELDYAQAIKEADERGDLLAKKAMEDETLDFNLQLIRQLYERGFTFEVIGDIKWSSEASSDYLIAELKLLESFGVRWANIPQSEAARIRGLDKWGRPRRW